MDKWTEEDVELLAYTAYNSYGIWLFTVLDGWCVAVSTTAVSVASNSYLVLSQKEKKPVFL